VRTRPRLERGFERGPWSPRGPSRAGWWPWARRAGWWGRWAARSTARPAGGAGGLGRATSCGPRRGGDLGATCGAGGAGAGGRARPRRRGACRRVKHREALSGGSLHALSHRRPCRRAAVCWMKGHLMPTGAVDEGTPDTDERGQSLPTLKTQDQDSVRALASLSNQTGCKASD